MKHNNILCKFSKFTVLTVFVFVSICIDMSPAAFLQDLNYALSINMLPQIALGKRISAFTFTFTFVFRVSMYSH